MKKLFISQPMRDKTEEQIKAERDRAIEKVKSILGKDDEISVIDSIAPKNILENHNSLWCLGWSLQKLSEADIAYFVEGWNGYRGCKLEHDACLEYKITSIFE